MSFSQALEHIKNGGKLTRTGWNGSNMYVFLHVGYETNENKYITGNKTDYMNPHFCIKDSDGSISTWVPSVGDCLADDWHLTM